MAADEPPYLTVGTDVSAKYKGAFCEAKIKKVARAVKCKVTFKNGQGTAVVPDDQIQGNLRVGAHIEAKHPDKNQMLEAVINKLLDYSQYTVVFDDGDETTLRRTSLCLKSGRHFAESESLDQLPLTNPEHFGTPVIGSKTRRKRNSVVCAAALDDESSEEDLPQPKRQPKDRRRASSASTASSASKNVDLGRVVCVEQGGGRGNKKENWFPALIVSPSAQENLRLKFDHLVRSFKDGKYFQVPKKDTKEFTRAMAAKVESPALKAAVEKALTFMDKDELPPNWDRDTLMGLNQQSEDSHDSDSDTSDDEPSEEKDRFVAQLYKFMDERGTPINRAPSVGSRDLNLYKLFKIVQKIGGYNRVTNLNQWKNVFLRLGLPNYNTTSSHQTKQAYKKYLHSFEDFFRKLGCTMVSNTRHSRGRYRTDRNLMMTRNRERDLSTTRAKSYSKSSKKDDEKRKTRTSLIKEESEEMMASTSGGLKDVCSSSASSLSSLGGLDDKKEGKVKRESSPSSVVEEKSAPREKKKEPKIKQEIRKNYLPEGGDSSDDNVPLIQEANIKQEKDDTPGKKEKVKRKDSRDESTSKKAKKGEEVKDTKGKMAFSDSKKQKKELKRCDSKDSSFQDRKSGESDLDSSDLDSPKNRKYSDGGMDDSFKKGSDSFGHKKPKKRKKEGGPNGDGDDDNDGKETDIEEFCQRTGGINIGDKIRVKYGHGGQHKIYEAKVLKIDEKLPKPYYVHYTGWNMRYDEWIRRSRIVENVSSSSVGKKKKSATSSKVPGPTKSSGKRGRPSLASVHSDSGSSTQSTSLSPASSRKTSSPTNSRSRHTRSDKTNLTGGLEPRKRVRRKSGATGETKDSDIDESLLSDIEDDGSESKSMDDKDEDPLPEDGEDESVKMDQYPEPSVVSHPSTSETCLKLGTDVLSKVESDDDQELLMRNEDNKDPLPIKIEEILDMISPLTDDNLPPSFAPHLDLNSPKEDARVTMPSSVVTEEATPSQAKETSVIVRRVSVEQEKLPIVEEPKASIKPDPPLNLSSATEIIGSLDEDTESEDEALINLCVPKKDETTPIKDTIPDPVNVVQVKESPNSSLECDKADEKEVTAINRNFLDCPIPSSVDLKVEEKKEVITCEGNISPPLRANSQLPSANQGSDSKEMVVVEEPPSIMPTTLVIPKEEPNEQLSFEVQDENTSRDVIVQKLVIEKPIVIETEKKIQVDVVEEEEDKYAWVDETEEKEEAERLREGISPKKEAKKKRKVQKQDAKDDTKPKPKKKKSENIEDLNKEHKQKKVKKNKIKKKNDKAESSDANSDGKKSSFSEAKTSTSLLASDKKKKEKKKKEEKKLSKLDIIEPSNESSLSESLKKKKIKKNKEKLIDSPLQDKKVKKKKKQLPFDDETEGDKSETDKTKPAKKKKRKSKLKETVISSMAKDPVIMPSSSTSTLEIKSTKEVKDTPKKEKKPKQDTSLLIPLSVNIKQEVEIEETEREMSFLLCEENVPASPVAVEPCPEKEDKIEEDKNYLGKLKSFAKITSTLAPSSSTPFGASSTSENTPLGVCFSHFPSHASSLELNNAAENVNANRVEAEMSAVLDNTPPTTPESSGSLLSSTPPHEDERADFKLIRNTTREAPECEDTSSRSTDSSTASTSSSGVLGVSSTLVPESRVQKTSYMSKRPKMDLDRHYEVLPTKRRRKSGKANEPTKPQAKNLITGRPIKVEKDADNSPNISSLHSTMECSYSDSLFINASPPLAIAPSLQSLSTAISTVPNIPIRPNRPSKFNFDDPLDDNVDANKRIAVLQDRMTELRKIYIGLKAEVALIDRRRKKAKKKDKDRDHNNSGASASSSKDNSNQGNSGSSSSLVQLTDTPTS